MSKRTDILDLIQLGLTSGEGRSLDLAVAFDEVEFGGETYEIEPKLAPVRLDISATTGHGFVFRLRFSAELTGPCMRCLEAAHLEKRVDSREVHQPTGGEDLQSPYVNEDSELALAEWAREALVLKLPTKITCRADCAGLCPECGANLNDHPDHSHAPPQDPRWDKLSEIQFE